MKIKYIEQGKNTLFAIINKLAALAIIHIVSVQNLIFCPVCANTNRR
jgi:hypothetical protein